MYEGLKAIGKSTFKWYEHETLLYKTKQCKKKGYIRCRKNYKVLYLFGKIPIWRTIGTKQFSNREVNYPNYSKN